MNPVCLIARKYKHDDIGVYYQIEDKINQKYFLIGINTINKEIAFYDDQGLENKLIDTIDLTSEEPVKEIHGIASNIVLLLSAKALQLIRNKNFPDNINLISH